MSPVSFRRAASALQPALVDDTKCCVKCVREKRRGVCVCVCACRQPSTQQTHTALHQNAPSPAQTVLIVLLLHTENTHSCECVCVCVCVCLCSHDAERTLTSSRDLTSRQFAKPQVCESVQARQCRMALVQFRPLVIFSLHTGGCCCSGPACCMEVCPQEGPTHPIPLLSPPQCCVSASEVFGRSPPSGA